MIDKYMLTSRDKWFFDKHMKDPVTQEPFRVGDNIIICANCKTVHYEDTWGMNRNKCCSCCGLNEKLQYNSFSSEIFQYGKSNSSSFCIVGKKLTFFQRIKLFNAYPIAYTIIVIIAVAFGIWSYFSEQYEKSIVINTVLVMEQEMNASLEVQGITKLDDITQNLYSKGERIKPKLESSVSTSFEEIMLKIQNNQLKENFSNLVSKIISKVSYVKIKVTNLFKQVLAYLSGVFNGFFCEWFVSLGGKNE